jgi:hypothetical protein
MYSRHYNSALPDSALFPHYTLIWTESVFIFPLFPHPDYFILSAMRFFIHIREYLYIAGTRCNTELTGYSLTFCGYGSIRVWIGGIQSACVAPQRYTACRRPTAAPP